MDKNVDALIIIINGKTNGEVEYFNFENGQVKRFQVGNGIQNGLFELI
jgi:hypothetical protein